MNAREEEFFQKMIERGMALMNEARKTNLDQEFIHSLAFSPESGYVRIETKVGNTIYYSHRFDQFPELEVKAVEDETAE